MDPFIVKSVLNCFCSPPFPRKTPTKRGLSETNRLTLSLSFFLCLHSATSMMDLDPEGLFRDDSDSENEFYQGKESTKEFVVYIVDASPNMFAPVLKDGHEKNESQFHVAVNSITQALKAQIIGSTNDEVAICFFNTKEKKNLQDISGVYNFNVAGRDMLDRPTARLIKEFSCIEEKFLSQIGSRYGIISDSRENSLYNSLWVAQALLRKGSSKTVDKRIILFTNEEDPFGGIRGPLKEDMIRTTVQRAKDAQDLGISIELLPLSTPEAKFDVSIFYTDLLGLDKNEVSQFITYAGERLDDLTNQLRKRMFKKRKVKTLAFSIAEGITVEVNTYALIRPTMPGSITWLDSVTNLPLKAERTYICADTGSLIHEQPRRFLSYKSQDLIISVDELSELKRVSTGQLHLLGFKPLNCLKDYHNLRPSTFVFPSDEEIIGSTCIFIALHRSMLRLERFAVAFLGSMGNPRLVALVAQDEVISPGGQVEPPGMHMIYLPYSDDIRNPEEGHDDEHTVTTRATEEQIKKASALLRKIDLKDFSVCQFSNPVLQKHYGILQAIALDEDDMPEIEDETLPDAEGMSRPGIVNAVEDFKRAVYGENYDQETDSTTSKAAESGVSKKRKALAENAVKESSTYDWTDLADSGRLKDLTVVELKYYLTANNLPVTGKKEALISRILTHLGK